MTGSPLPSFAHPPVDEVACSLQFSTALPLKLLDLAAIAEAFADRYPIVEEQPPLPPIPQGNPRFAVQFGVDFELPRLFFTDRASTNLVQLQRDRFGVNWRRVGGVGEYPRYEANVRPALVDACNRLSKALAARNMSFPQIASIEVAYINPIVIDEGRDMTNVLRPWSGLVGSELEGAPQSINLQLGYRIPEINGSLTVQVGTAIRTDDGTNAILMNLVARAEVNGPLEEALRCVDVARSWIVNGFTALTTDEMHDQWKRDPS